MLRGIRVLDFSRYIAGPYCASILADLGADVIRIEPVGGGEDRLLVPVTDDGQGALFIQMNRNKRSLAMNTGSEELRHILDELIVTSDVVVTNMPVEALKRQRLDYERLASIRTDIIATNLSAFGHSGSLRGKTGFDAVAQAVSGAAYLGGRSGNPSRAASSYVDYGTGLAGAMGTLAAVIERLRSGKGQNVQASLLATAMTFINAAHIEAAATDLDRHPWGNRSPFSGPSDLFGTLDGAIAVQVVGNV
ncbi:CaiB/BaiF CoA transferase family protein, partial [Rhizobiaceae sp. 2RAB30]